MLFVFRKRAISQNKGKKCNQQPQLMGKRYLNGHGLELQIENLQM